MAADNIRLIMDWQVGVWGVGGNLYDWVPCGKLMYRLSLIQYFAMKDKYILNDIFAYSALCSGCY